MNGGILIAGNESALLHAIEAEAAAKAESFVLAIIPNRFSGKGDRLVPSADHSGHILLDWNPGSPISARTLVLAAENRLGYISEAILVCDPSSACSSAAGLNLADVEVMASDHIKGWFFLARELAAAFKMRNGGSNVYTGTLALVYPDSGAITGKENTKDGAGTYPVDLLGPPALAAFRSLTTGLLASSSGEPYLTLGFAGGDTGDDSGFAGYIFKQLDEKNRRNSGKLFKYGKMGFFR